MSLLKGVDSFSAPTTQQLALAKAAGVAAWNGYLPGKGIDSTWTSADSRVSKTRGCTASPMRPDGPIHW